MKRRKLLRNLAFTPLLLGARNMDYIETGKDGGPRLQYSVNAYSFNTILKNGEMTLIEMMEFAASIGLNAVDITGYYFPSYPEIPSNEEVFELKRKALQLGLNISWTGIRNDFVNPDSKAREADRELIKNWLEVSSKLGASIMRIFAGTHKHEGYSRTEVKKWLVNEFKICAGYAEETGVLVALQHHNDFFHNSEEIIEVIKRVDSKWFGLMLDVGSISGKNPYEEIQNLASYADYWFVKEYFNSNDKTRPVNMKRVAEIIDNEGYQGYVSFENLSEDNPKQNIKKIIDSFRNEYDKL